LETVNARLTALVEVGGQLGLERDPLRLIESYCHAAREIIGARYAAIGLLADGGRQFGHFFWSGLESHIAANILIPSPQQGLVGTVLRERRPLRIAELSTAHNAASFVPPHPRHGAFLGVAIASPSQLYGVLYLIEKIGLPEFGEDNERMAV